MRRMHFGKKNGTNGCITVAEAEVATAEAVVQFELPKAKRRPMSWMGMTLLMTNLGLAVLVICSWFQFGSIGAALSYLKGDRLIPDAYTKDLGNVEQDVERNVAFMLKNMSDRTIKILGAKSSCSCVVADQMPITIRPASVFPFWVTFHSGNQGGRITQSIQLFTDFPLQPSQTLRLVVWVVESSPNGAPSSIPRGSSEHSHKHR